MQLTQLTASVAMVLNKLVKRVTQEMSQAEGATRVPSVTLVAALSVLHAHVEKNMAHVTIARHELIRQMEITLPLIQAFCIGAESVCGLTGHETTTGQILLELRMGAEGLQHDLAMLAAELDLDELQQHKLVREHGDNIVIYGTHEQILALA